MQAFKLHTKRASHILSQLVMVCYRAECICIMSVPNNIISIKVSLQGISLQMQCIIGRRCSSTISSLTYKKTDKQVGIVQVVQGALVVACQQEEIEHRLVVT
ncbi:hypothetical protein HPP92_022985 [Vanilla planifolia]|uniref:Uncharacterized protein n=1 Tax=Vanilla planifolia TaxID=51239 RepID=A0A835UEA6_VANPL|nr:hypothetical protein HPP92_023250 [Vanilla planifolia]KAG0459857.1 hypothetical protein HPP92_022985 [Vanilla planifolia]